MFLSAFGRLFSPLEAKIRIETAPAARGARAPWPLGRREVPAAYGLRRTRRRPIAIFPVLCLQPFGIFNFRGATATVPVDENVAPVLRFPPFLGAGARPGFRGLAI